MPAETGSKAEPEDTAVELKNPALAAFLAWLVPGLGHFYQGRWAKGLLFSVSILGTFCLGLFLGSNSEVGPGRVVYFARDPMRPHFLCQIWAGAVAFPAVYQYKQYAAGKSPNDSFFGRFMWPPRSDGDFNDRQFGRGNEADALHLSLHRFFELGTVYTMIAGLLNILVIFDAGAGPAPIVDDPKKTPTSTKAADEAAQGTQSSSAPSASTTSTTPANPTATAPNPAPAEGASVGGTPAARGEKS